MSTGLEGRSCTGFGSRSKKISMQQHWAIEVVEVTAEMLNTTTQSGGLKQATQKRRKKGKEWKGKSCDSKQGNNVLFVLILSYAFYRKSWACASFRGENTSTILSKTTVCAESILDLELWPGFVIKKLFSIVWNNANRGKKNFSV